MHLCSWASESLKNYVCPGLSPKIWQSDRAGKTKIVSVTLSGRFDLSCKANKSGCRRIHSSQLQIVPVHHEGSARVTGVHLRAEPMGESFACREIEHSASRNADKFGCVDDGWKNA